MVSIFGLDGGCGVVVRIMVRVVTLETDSVSVVIVATFHTFGSNTGFVLIGTLMTREVGLFNALGSMVQWLVGGGESEFLVVVQLSDFCGDGRVLLNTSASCFKYLCV